MKLVCKYMLDHGWSLLISVKFLIQFAETHGSGECVSEDHKQAT